MTKAKNRAVWGWKCDVIRLGPTVTLKALQMETLALFAAAGVRVVPVEDLGEPATWVSSHRILLIDTHLTTEQRHQVACAFLPAVLSTPLSSG